MSALIGESAVLSLYHNLTCRLYLLPDTTRKHKCVLYGSPVNSQSIH